jgi:hypothetical protein
MLRLDSLTIGRYRNVAPTRLEFGPRFNVLLGKNGTGKTTLLKLLGNVIGDDLSPLRSEDEDWEIAFTLVNDDVRLRAEVRSAVESERARGVRAADLGAHRDHTVVATIELSRGTETWEWPAVGRGIQPSAGGGRSLLLKGVLDAHFRAALAMAFDRGDEDGLESRLWNSVGHYPRGHERFDEALASFDYLVALELNVAREAAGGWRVSTSTLPAFIDYEVEQLLFTSAPTVSNLSIPLGELRRMRRCADLLEARELSFVPTLVENHQEGGSARVRYQGLRVLLTRANGLVSHERFSFGQKRLVAFFWHLEACGDAPVIADELVNGLHHEWIEACVAELENQQSFLASQHPLLLDYIPIDSIEEARKTFIRCTTEVREGREMMVWRNLTEEEATRFFEAKQAGIRHVSEILRSQGLW